MKREREEAARDAAERIAGCPYSSTRQEVADCADCRAEIADRIREQQLAFGRRVLESIGFEWRDVNDMGDPMRCLRMSAGPTEADYHVTEADLEGLVDEETPG